MISVIIFTLITVTEITTQPVSVFNAVLFDEVTLTCSASIDDVTYSWHRVEGDIPLKSWGQDYKTLTIPKVTPHDHGMYYCMASKDGVVVKSDVATVAVYGEKLDL